MLLKQPAGGTIGNRRAGFLLRDLVGTGFLAMGSLGIGLLVNNLRRDPLPLIYVSPAGRLHKTVAQISAKSPPVDAQIPVPNAWETITLVDFQDLVAARRSIVIDARAKSFYQEAHVPGAINLPREEFETSFSNVRALIEPAKDQPIVIYCSEADCKDSELVADALSRLGYRHLFVYKEGWEEWLRAGLPQETGHSF